MDMEMQMDWMNVRDTTNGLFGIMTVIGMIFASSLVCMWLSCFYILYSWRCSQRKTSAERRRQRTPKINHIISNGIVTPGSSEGTPDHSD